MRRPDAGWMGIFAANLSLILSILWCFCKSLVFLLPLLHASFHSPTVAPAPAEVGLPLLALYFSSAVGMQP